jgi:hypothetical protein
MPGRDGEDLMTTHVAWGYMYNSSTNQDVHNKMYMNILYVHVVSSKPMTGSTPSATRHNVWRDGK